MIFLQPMLMVQDNSREYYLIPEKSPRRLVFENWINSSLTSGEFEEIPRFCGFKKSAGRRPITHNSHGGEM